MLPINQLLNLGRYRITQSLGQNGTGLLYEAFDNTLQSKVVLKEIVVKLGKVSTVSKQEMLKLAFANEAKSLKAINHDSFLQIYDYFSEIDRHYLVMEANDASNLKDLLEKNGRAFSYPDVINWAEQLLDALAYLHSQIPTIIHRDIKPQNLKLTADKKIKLSSPGISKLLSEKINSSEVNQPSSSTSLHFLPLEQIWEGLDSASQKVITNSYDEKSEDILKKPTDQSSDIYALGATLYYLLTAKLPIDALERSIDILEGKSDPLPSPHQLNESVPVELSEILMKALEIKRENRFDLVPIMRQVLRTAVLQIKGREAEEAKTEEEREEAEALLELRLAKAKQIEIERQMIEQKTLEIEADEKRLEMERQIIEKKKLEVEAERKRQEEALQQKQRQVETKKPEAAKSVAKTESALFDDDILELGNQKSAPIPDKKVEPIAQPTAAFTKAASASASSSDTIVNTVSQSENDELFSDTHKSGNGFWKIPAIAVALLVFGGAGFGIWYSQKANTDNSNQAVPTQAVSSDETVKPAETNEPASLPTTNNSVEATNAPANGLNQTSATPTTVKTKPVATPTPVKPKKQNTPPPQTADNQKKPVTVDDLINDN